MRQVFSLCEMNTMPCQLFPLAESSLSSSVSGTNPFFQEFGLMFPLSSLSQETELIKAAFAMPWIRSRVVGCV